jgi:hypothetical protein
MSRGNRLRSEATEQEHVVSWCLHREGMYPDLKWIHHCPNGGSRQKSEAYRLKAQGVKAGVPDLNLPVQKGSYIGLYIEMKYDDGTIEPSQKEWIKAMKAAGHFACVCYGFDYAIKVIEEYVNLLPDQTMSYENGIVLKDRKRGKEVVL